MIKELVFDGHKCLVNIVNKNEHIQKHWEKGVFYEQNMLHYIYTNYKKGLTYIDAGACIGNHTLFFAKIMEAKMVYSFEPIGYIFEDLMNNIYNNKLTNVKAFKDALGDKKESICMQISNPLKNIGMSKKSIVETGYKVNSYDIDFFEFDNVDIFKIDIEGLNIPVLNGATKTINKYKPDIFIESTEDFLDVKNYLMKFGYKYTGKQFNRTPTHLFSCKW